jgi:hypothetical protein
MTVRSVRALDRGGSIELSGMGVASTAWGVTRRFFPSREI